MNHLKLVFKACFIVGGQSSRQPPNNNPHVCCCNFSFSTCDELIQCRMYENILNLFIPQEVATSKINMERQDTVYIVRPEMTLEIKKMHELKTCLLI